LENWRERAEVILNQILDPCGPLVLEDFLDYKKMGAFNGWYMTHEDKQYQFVDPLRYFMLLEFHQLLIYKVRNIREKGISYRGFKVGALAIAHHKYHGYYPPFWGANIKKKPDDETQCAELCLIKSAEDAGFEQIVVLAVSGPLQKDEINGCDTPTLHPCWRCRDLFKKSPLIHPKTLILTVHPDLEVFELRTVEQLINFHKER
jgi:cytidine deaminase